METFHWAWERLLCGDITHTNVQSATTSGHIRTVSDLTRALQRESMKLSTRAHDVALNNS
jgi:hypothetical protein